jgi:hypothetical protein
MLWAAAAAARGDTWRGAAAQAANCAAAISKSATIAWIRFLHDDRAAGAVLPLADDATISCNANDKTRLETGV